jgi:hypothetical protein
MYDTLMLQFRASGRDGAGSAISLTTITCIRPMRRLLVWSASWGLQNSVDWLRCEDEDMPEEGTKDESAALKVSTRYALHAVTSDTANTCTAEDGCCTGDDIINMSLEGSVGIYVVD